VNDSDRPVVVIGAGLTGLTAAHRLARAGHPVLVLEKDERPGGVIRTRRERGFLAEHSANSMMIKAQEVEDLILDLGLNDRLVESNPEAKKRFLLRDGKVLPMPMSAGQAVATPLYSFGAKLRLLKEPFVPAAPADGDESVGSFVRRRMGPEFLDYGIAALVSGIYAGDPDRLSVRHAFPKVWNLEARYGSLIGGAVKLMRERKRTGEKPYKSRIVSFREGLETLTGTLAATVGDGLKLGARVTRIAREGVAWRVAWTDADGSHEVLARALVSTVPLPALAALPWPEALGRACAGLPVPPHPPVTTLSLGFRREQVAHPMDGFGLLAPLVERRRILGSLFSSTLFPGRAPDEHVLMMVFMGGAMRPELAVTREDEAVAIAMAELGELFGVRGEPVFVHHVHWPAAIPQYNVGHGRLLAALADLETAHPGLHFAGNFRGGPGLNDCVVSGLALARGLS
jgi:oxygen-dependent protoporphyrinogen oxidase